ncbi:hypothetical protein [Pseudomonas fluorescens]|uniref:hypothetical protein n=1 Tax=Pseudomonas fluorescens TaxID=294 RepID=UPI002856B35F|nr:hypothetical protein [Pseudomonas fluorescens]MDR6163535.1 hypothetical protein [Pseudomonas fluorescens]
MSEEWPTKTRIPSAKRVLQSLTETDHKIIALEATVAQQAKMIEHLRGGLGNEPQLVSYAEDMSTCTLTTGDGTGYFYDRVDADQPALYTAVDMANAARGGFRDGVASKSEPCDGCFMADAEALREANDKLTRRNAMLEENVQAMTETHVLYTWLRKKCDQSSNDFVAVQMNIGHDWVPVHDLDRDLRSMIEREEP